MKASEFIMKKLVEAGEEVKITLLNHDTCYFTLGGSNFFLCEKLPGQYVTFNIFDIVVDFLKKQPHGRAIKGGARGSKVGYDKCQEGTIMYEIATKYYGKEIGESSFDPLFVIAAILEWAGVASNERGYVELHNVAIW